MKTPKSLQQKNLKTKLFLLLSSTVSILFNLPSQAMDFSLDTDDPVLLWNQATLEAISNTNMGPTPTSRALGLVNTSIYDAWAAYDPVAIGTQLGNTLQVSNEEINPENKRTAISHAAYTTLSDLFPNQEPAFTHLMQQLGFDFTITSTNTNTAAGIGNLAAKTLLDNKYTDGSNQLNNAKEHYDYVRPVTAIQYLAANNLLPNEHPIVRTNPQNSELVLKTAAVIKVCLVL